MTRWFHGTSDEAGLDDGDTIDPSCGSFDRCVWATSSIEIARRFARSRAALGGSPVVFEIVIADGAEIVEQTMDETDYGVDADAIYFARGESGVAELAIIRRGIATARAL
jgi:hypothetical protein